MNEASRIDYFLIQNDLLNSVISSDIRPAQISKTSHLSVSLKLKLGEQSRGSGLWKINNSILQDENYRSLIIRKIENSKSTSARSNFTAHNVWEKNTIDVREATQSYSKLKEKQIRNRCTFLENTLQTLHQIQDENMDINENLKTEIMNKVRELYSIYEYRAKGAQIRARAEWIEQGEKNTIFFLNIEKSRQIKKKIKTLNSTELDSIYEYRAKGAQIRARAEWIEQGENKY